MGNCVRDTRAAAPYCIHVMVGSVLILIDSMLRCLSRELRVIYTFVKMKGDRKKGQQLNDRKSQFNSNEQGSLDRVIERTSKNGHDARLGLCVTHRTTLLYRLPIMSIASLPCVYSSTWCWLNHDNEVGESNNIDLFHAMWRGSWQEN
jgi:hypothetical protein